MHVACQSLLSRGSTEQAVTKASMQLFQGMDTTGVNISNSYKEKKNTKDGSINISSQSKITYFLSLLT